MVSDIPFRSFGGEGAGSVFDGLLGFCRLYGVRVNDQIVAVSVHDLMQRPH